MSKFWTVLFHTYCAKLKTKSFIITSLIAAVLLLAVTNFQQIADLFEDHEPPKIAVIDPSGTLYQPLKQLVDESDMKLHAFSGSEVQAQQQVKKGAIQGYLLLKLQNGLPSAVYKANKIVEQKVPEKLQQALQQLKVAMATKKLGLDAATIAKVYAPVTFQKVALAKGAKSEDELNKTRSIVYVLLFFLYFSVIFYGSMIAMEVATEKSSRVMEILISSVSPVKQMFGKIIGIVLLGLTQFAFLFAVGYVSAVVKGSSSSFTKVLDMLHLGNMPRSLIVYALLFFLLGHFLYSTLFAMLGSLVDRVEEANQMMSPVIMTLVIAFLIATTGLGNPDSSIVTVSSFIPFFAPMTMFLRIGMLSVPWWQVVLCIAIMLATISFFIYFGARIYSGGVLMYGKTSWKNLRKAFVLSKTEK